MLCQEEVGVMSPGRSEAAKGAKHGSGLLLSRLTRGPHNVVVFCRQSKVREAESGGESDVKQRTGVE